MSRAIWVLKKYKLLLLSNTIKQKTRENSTQKKKLMEAIRWTSWWWLHAEDVFWHLLRQNERNWEQQLPNQHYWKLNHSPRHTDGVHVDGANPNIVVCKGSFKPSFSIWSDCPIHSSVGISMMMRNISRTKMMTTVIVVLDRNDTYLYLKMCEQLWIYKYIYKHVLVFNSHCHCQRTFVAPVLIITLQYCWTSPGKEIGSHWDSAPYLPPIE